VTEADAIKEETVDNISARNPSSMASNQYVMQSKGDGTE
jgi:hypothetical protein